MSGMRDGDCGHRGGRHVAAPLCTRWVTLLVAVLPCASGTLMWARSFSVCDSFDVTFGRSHLAMWSADGEMGYMFTSPVGGGHMHTVRPGIRHDPIDAK